MPRYIRQKNYATVHSTEKLCHGTFDRKTMPRYTRQKSYATVHPTEKLCHGTFDKKTMPRYTRQKNYATVHQTEKLCHGTPDRKTMPRYTRQKNYATAHSTEKLCHGTPDRKTMPRYTRQKNSVSLVQSSLKSIFCICLIKTCQKIKTNINNLYFAEKKKFHRSCKLYTKYIYKIKHFSKRRFFLPYLIEKINVL